MGEKKREIAGHLRAMRGPYLAVGRDGASVQTGPGPCDHARGADTGGGEKKSPLSRPKFSGWNQQRQQPAPHVQLAQREHGGQDKDREALPASYRANVVIQGQSEDTSRQ